MRFCSQSDVCAARCPADAGNLRRYHLSRGAAQQLRPSSADTLCTQLGLCLLSEVLCSLKRSPCAVLYAVLQMLGIYGGITFLVALLTSCGLRVLTLCT
jgi:hypothetical protein